MVVSLNILSQLWVIPRAYALKKLHGLEDEELDDWCGQIVSSHYAFLQSLPCDVCLVADFEFIKRDKNGVVASHGSTIFNLALPPPEESWTWNIAPMSKTAGFCQRIERRRVAGAITDRSMSCREHPDAEEGIRYREIR